MSFVSLIKKQSGGKGIYYILATDSTDQPAWYYLKVASAKATGFEKSCETGCDLAEWGEVLMSGYGKRAPNYFRRKMKEEYGFEHSDS